MSTNCVVGVFTLLCLLSTALGEVNIVTRLEWNAKESANALTPLQLPVGIVVIAHTVQNDCHTKDLCSQQVRNIQNYHISKLHFDDIGYNYLIGNDGNVYEGRGSDYQGAVAKGYNNVALGIAFMGNFTTALPSGKALAAAKLLLDKLVTLQKLQKDYKLYAHSQVSTTTSPGAALVEEIKTWPNWSN